MRYSLLFPLVVVLRYHDTVLAMQATVAYYLLLDNRLRTTSGYLGSEFQESMVSVIFFSCISRC